MVSTAKTFIASSRKAETALKMKLGKDGPPIQQLGKDLGMETAAGRRRTTKLSAGRRAKANVRLRKLHAARVGSPKVASRLFNVGVIASACWGHQLQGVSPKVLKTIRVQAAQIAGQVATVGQWLRFFGPHYNWENPPHAISEGGLQMVWQGAFRCRARPRYPVPLVPGSLNRGACHL